ncbi:hypothetical protein [Sphingomonas sp.]|uniref:hypothetical protein n=1 Tax=Sphingomonas sp. TaxID=28214 RepID=UPI002BFF49C8|nr:hypothetical protein [Sphingomonas sp.]HTG39694.1 hypothetical protein [Sphingomonas sp.]
MTKVRATDEQPRIRAKITNNWMDYPHNDLSSAAWYFLQRINKAFAESERADRIFPDMIACVTMMAFALEGYVNFIGAKLLDGKPDEWRKFEGAKVRDKIKAIRRLTGLQIDWNKRPYSTTTKLIDLRNILAHPKAHRAEPSEWLAEGTDSDFKRMLRDYEPAWVKIINQTFVDEAYADVEAIWKSLLAAAKIEEHEAWSGGSQGFELIDCLPPDQPV